MTTIRAAVIAGPVGSAVELREYPEPDLQPGGIKADVLYSEVCGTDEHLRVGRYPAAVRPFVPGHVSVVRINKMRGEIMDIDGYPFEEGDVVGFMDVYGTCGRCRACLVDKASTSCPHRRVYGITMGDGLYGGWAESIHLLPGTMLIRLPKGLSPRTYCGGGCGLNTAFHTAQRAEIHLGDTVVVIGAGPVGQSIVAFARLSGASRVLVLDLDPRRLTFAAQMGATSAFGVDSTRDQRLQWVMDHTDGRGADVVIEAAGPAVAVAEACDMVRKGGMVVSCGQYTDSGTAVFHPHSLGRSHLTFRTSWGSDFSHFERSTAVMGREHSRFAWDRMIGGEFTLDQINDAVAAVQNRTMVKAAVTPNPDLLEELGLR